jgi:hypothetical protein
LKHISDRRCTQWAVVTTINEPTEAVERQALEQEWCLVVIGDRKGPRTYPLPNAVNWTVFLDDQAQETFVGEHPLGKLLPWNHFGRKNLGFIFAIMHGAQAIFDFDDDNMLLDINPSAIAPNGRENSSGKRMRGHGGPPPPPTPTPHGPIHGRKLPISANTVHHKHTDGSHDHIPSQSSANKTNATNTATASATAAVPAAVPADGASTNSGNSPKNVLRLPGAHTPDNLYSVNIPFAYNFTLLNPYPLMGATVSPAWPRGYPLHLIKSTYHHYHSISSDADPANAANHPHLIAMNNFILHKATVPAQSVGVVQYLANNDPDVDAIYRLIQPLPLNFALSHHPLLLPLNNANQQQVYCPYNAQATLHMHSALWTLLLPISVHGRVSDIWRSYFAQRLMADVDLSVVFHPPYIVQYRNSHNYLADFDSEGPLYLEAGMLVEQLTAWYSCAPTLPERMETLWIMLYERGYIQKNDVDLMQVWLQTLLEVQYPFPEIKHTHSKCTKQ